jgi:hypothetical protein
MCLFNCLLVGQDLLTLQENLISGSAHPSGGPDFRICLPFMSTWFQDLLTLLEHLILGSGQPSGAPDFSICLPFRSTWFQDLLTLQEHLISGSAFPSGTPDFRICLPFRSTWFHPRFLVGFALVDLECMFCRSLIVSLYFFFWPMYCLSFNVRILIIRLVSPIPSCTRLLYIQNQRNKIKYFERVRGEFSVHKTFLNPATFYWSAYTNQENDWFPTQWKLANVTAVKIIRVR